MSIAAVRNQAQLDGVVGPPDEEIALYRDYLHNSTLSQGLGGRPFEGLSWDYFLADVQLEARAAYAASCVRSPSNNQLLFQHS
jgi:hypothetical protein